MPSKHILTFSGAPNCGQNLVTINTSSRAMPDCRKPSPIWLSTCEASSVAPTALQESYFECECLPHIPKRNPNADIQHEVPRRLPAYTTLGHLNESELRLRNRWKFSEPYLVTRVQIPQRVHLHNDCQGLAYENFGEAPWYEQGHALS